MVFRAGCGQARLPGAECASRPAVPACSRPRTAPGLRSQSVPPDQLVPPSVCAIMDKLTHFLERRSLTEVTLLAVSAGTGLLALAISFGNPLALI